MLEIPAESRQSEHAPFHPVGRVGMLPEGQDTRNADPFDVTLTQRDFAEPHSATTGRACIVVWMAWLVSSSKRLLRSSVRAIGGFGVTFGFDFFGLRCVFRVVVFDAVYGIAIALLAFVSWPDLAWSIVRMMVHRLIQSFVRSNGPSRLE